MSQAEEGIRVAEGASWQARLEPFKRADTRRALVQLTLTALLFALGWVAMYASLDISYALTLLLALPVAGLYIRLFIIQHDCGHGAFLPSRRANDLIGFWIGVLTLTPYRYWRRTHQIHHATHGDLDRRGTGDIETLTVREYLDRSFWGRLGYRLYRHPVVMFGIGPFWVFALKHRLPLDMPWDRKWKREWRDVMLTNLVLAVLLVLAHYTIGLASLFLVQGPIFLFGAAAGVWLFYVQHQFEETYWERPPEWRFEAAGLEGSSFYDLPPILHWFTGNIGYHHIHHLSARVPNYRLRECMDAVPELHRVTKITLRESLGCLRLKLWDESSGKLVGWRHLRRARA